MAPREINYSVIEKECLAIKWATHALRYYLLGRSFSLITDHAPLRWLHTMKDNNARITRWYLALQPFHYTVKHRAGKEHQNADFFSREGGPLGNVELAECSFGITLRGEICDRERKDRCCKSPSRLERVLCKGEGKLPPRSASVVGGNRKVTILGGARSCKYSGRFHCSQLRGSPLLEKPGDALIAGRSFLGTKGKQLRQYLPLR